MTGPLVHNGNHAVSCWELWQEMSARLERVIAGRHADSASDAADIVQEVSVRLLQRDEGFESEQHLWNWCLRVARNHEVDNLRARHTVAVPDLDDRRLAASADERLPYQQGLDAIVEAVHRGTVTPAQLAFLVSHEVSPDRAQQNRDRVTRHRLRQRLAPLVSGLLGLLGLGGHVRLRRVSRVSVVAAVPIVALASIPLVSHRDSGGGRPTTRSVTQPAGGADATSSVASSDAGADFGQSAGNEPRTGPSATGERAGKRKGWPEPDRSITIQPVSGVPGVTYGEEDAPDDGPPPPTYRYRDTPAGSGCIDRPRPTPDPLLPPGTKLPSVIDQVS